MNIIIEGCDNSGKSTLIEGLQRFVKRDVFHNIADKDSASVANKIDRETDTSSSLLYDRSAAISEYIYCEALQRKPVIDVTLDTISNVCDNAIVIFCMPGIDVCLATEKEEMQGVRENIYKIYNGYDKLVDNLWCLKKQFYIFDRSIDTIKEVMDYIKSRNLAEWQK